MPRVFPATVATALARPQAMALAMVKSTDGPGAKMIKIVAIRYSQRRDGSRSELNTPQPYAQQACLRPVPVPSILPFDSIDSIYLMDISKDT